MRSQRRARAVPWLGALGVATCLAQLLLDESARGGAPLWQRSLILAIVVAGAYRIGQSVADDRIREATERLWREVRAASDTTRRPQ